MTNKFNTEHPKYSVNALVDWMDYAKNSGLMNETTAIVKKVAVLEILVRNDLLQEHEKNDVREIDHNEIFSKYLDIHPNKQNKTTQNAYKSRLKGSISFFINYTNDPSKFPSNSYKITPARRQRQLNRTNPMPQTASASNNTSQINNNNLFTFDLHVPVKGGEQMVTISNIPRDIGKDDIKRISALVLALG